MTTAEDWAACARRIKQLERAYDELRTVNNRLQVALARAHQAMAASARQKPALWIQSDHLTRMQHPKAGKEAHLFRLANYQIHPDFKPLYTSPPAQDAGL